MAFFLVRKALSSAQTLPRRGFRHLSSVPVINVSSLTEVNSIQRSEVVTQIAEACEEWGFFQVVNHGFSDEVFQRYRVHEKRLFSLPQEQLMSIRRTEANSRGYYEAELTKNRRDWKELFDFGAQDGSVEQAGLDGENQWPVGEPELKAAFLDYFFEAERLSRTLTGAFAEGLGLPATAFDQYFLKHTSYLRLNYYPVCPDPSQHMAVHHHSDAGFLTVLRQDDDIASLQVQSDTGDWVDVQPVPGAFVINVGDMAQVWSNNRYKAPLHRVKANATTERYSCTQPANSLMPSRLPASSLPPQPDLLSPPTPPHTHYIAWPRIAPSRKKAPQLPVLSQVPSVISLMSTLHPFLQSRYSTRNCIPLITLLPFLSLSHAIPPPLSRPSRSPLLPHFPDARAPAPVPSPPFPPSYRPSPCVAPLRRTGPFFFNPSYEATVAPLPSCVDAAHPAAYRPINWGDFRRARADGDYANVGTEVQISHFAL